MVRQGSGVITMVGSIGGLAHQPQADLVREQFLEREPALRRMAAFVQQLEIRVGRRPVHVAQRDFERRQFERVEHAGRHVVLDGTLRQHRQGHFSEDAQPSLLHAFRRRIDRRQAVGR